MSSPNLHPMLNVAVKAARAAGAIINRAALDVESVRVSQKQVNDFVTEVDHASEAVIIETDEKNGPFGAKGIGEPGLVPTAPPGDFAVICVSLLTLSRPGSSRRRTSAAATVPVPVSTA